MLGLGPSSHIFTKLMAAAITFLRRQLGILIIAYIDDLLIQAADKQTCHRHIKITILLLQNLGYGVNFGKSAFTPSKTVEHLGFTWDSDNMMVSLPQAKIDKIVSSAKLALEEGGIKAGSVRSLLGSLESLRLATMLAFLYIRSLQYLQPRPGPRQDFLVKR